jgi:hypothetical protein
MCRLLQPISHFARVYRSYWQAHENTQVSSEGYNLLVKPGYYNGADLTNSHKLLGDERPSTWKDFLSRAHQPIRQD